MRAANVDHGRIFVASSTEHQPSEPFSFWNFAVILAHFWNVVLDILDSPTYIVLENAGALLARMYHPGKLFLASSTPQVYFGNIPVSMSTFFAAIQGFSSLICLVPMLWWKILTCSAFSSTREALSPRHFPWAWAEAAFLAGHPLQILGRSACWLQVSFKSLEWPIQPVVSVRLFQRSLTSTSGWLASWMIICLGRHAANAGCLGKLAAIGGSRLERPLAFWPGSFRLSIMHSASKVAHEIDFSTGCLLAYSVIFLSDTGT